MFQSEHTEQVEELEDEHSKRKCHLSLMACVPDRVPRQFQDYKRGGMEVSN